MAVDPTFLILKTPFWLPISEESILGTAVKNILSPTNGYVPENASKYYHGLTVEHKWDHFVLQTGSASGRVAKAELTKIIGFQWIGKEDVNFNLRGKLLRYKRIKQYSKFWRKLVEDEDVQKEVPEWFHFFGPPVCAVMGLFICEDVDVATSQEDFDKLTAQGQAPLGTLLASSAGLPIQGGDLSAGGGVENRNWTYFEAKQKGKSIFALELKKLKKKGGTILLTDKSPSAPKGRSLAAGEGEDVDVKDLELEDLDEAEWDGDWEKVFQQASSPQPEE